MKKIDIIIDCDPGIDDAFALAIALQDPSLNILGIHTVSGNVSLDNTTRNTQGIVGMLKSDVPIYRGNDVPIVFDPIFAADIHGENGLAGYQFDDKVLSEVSELTSVQGYVKALSESEDKVVIVAVGPLTNVAILIKSHPELISKIDYISIMGGGLRSGNTTEAGEFNFYVDPHAADIVFKSGIPIVMAGLDVTQKAYITSDDIDYIRDNGGDIGRMLHEVSQSGLERGTIKGMPNTTTPNDVVSVLYLTHPEIFKGEDLRVIIDYNEGVGRGQSVADLRNFSKPTPNAKVLLEVDVDQFRNTVKRKLTER